MNVFHSEISTDNPEQLHEQTNFKTNFAFVYP